MGALERGGGTSSLLSSRLCLKESWCTAGGKGTAHSEQRVFVTPRPLWVSLLPLSLMPVGRSNVNSDCSYFGASWENKTKHRKLSCSLFGRFGISMLPFSEFAKWVVGPLKAIKQQERIVSPWRNKKTEGWNRWSLLQPALESIPGLFFLHMFHSMSCWSANSHCISKAPHWSTSVSRIKEMKTKTPRLISFGCKLHHSEQKEEKTSLNSPFCYGSPG